jgi:2-methylcitrate dehydratase PrpD
MGNGMLDQFADYVLSASYEEMPVSVRNAIWGCMAYNFFCAFAGSKLPWSVAACTVSHQGDGPSTIWGTGKRTTVTDAAFANAALGQSILNEDFHLTSVTHPGSVTFASLISVGEMLHSAGEEVLEAAVVAYDVIGKVGGAMWTDEFRARGFRPTGIFGPIGCAAGCAKLMGLDHEKTRNAMALACNCSSSLREWAYAGTSDIYFHNAGAAAAGVRSALLAREGVTAPSMMLEGNAGLIQAYSGVSGIERLEAEIPTLGTVYEVENTWLKPYPTCGSVAHIAQIALRIHEEEGPDPSRIARIEIGTHKHGKINPGCDNKGPYIGIAQAQMSNQFAVATALIHGEVAIDHYIDYGDPGINRLTSLTEVVLDDACEQAYPGQRMGWVKVYLDDGRCIEKAKPDLDVVLTPLDHPAIMERVQRYAREAFEEKAASEIVRSIGKFSELDDITYLFPQ